MTAVARKQDGIALLSVLGILSVLLVLGSLVAGSSRMESALSGTAKRSARAFAAADAGLNVGLGDANNFVQLGERCTNLKNAGIVTTGEKVQGDVCVQYQYQAAPPPSVKVSALKFVAFHFDIDATGTAETGATSSLRMEAARLGPAQ
jgi:hypothetical protein